MAAESRSAFGGSLGMPAEIPAFNRTTAGLMARIRAGRTGTSGALADVTNLGVQVGFAPTSFGEGETRRRAWEVAQRRKEREKRAKEAAAKILLEQGRLDDILKLLDDEKTTEADSQWEIPSEAEI